MSKVFSVSRLRGHREQISALFQKSSARFVGGTVAMLIAQISGILCAHLQKSRDYDGHVNLEICIPLFGIRANPNSGSCVCGDIVVCKT